MRQSVRVSLITEALSKAADNNGVWLNEEGTQYPRVLSQRGGRSPFNAMVLGLTSTNQTDIPICTRCSVKPRNRDEAVMAHEREVCRSTGMRGTSMWTDIIRKTSSDRKDYQELSATDQTQYKGIHNREIRVLFNIDQTMLPLKDKEKYEEVVKANVGANEDKALRSRWMTSSRRWKETWWRCAKTEAEWRIMTQKRCCVYAQSKKTLSNIAIMCRDVAPSGECYRTSTATGKEGMVMKNGIAPSEDAVKQEKLVVELASGIKMMEMGMSAKISKENMGLVDYWNRELKENPCLIDAMRVMWTMPWTLSAKAERGEKMEYSSSKNEQQTTEMQSADAQALLCGRRDSQASWQRAEICGDCKG